MTYTQKKTIKISAKIRIVKHESTEANIKEARHIRTQNNDKYKKSE